MVIELNEEEEEIIEIEDSDNIFYDSIEETIQILKDIMKSTQICSF